MPVEVPALAGKKSPEYLRIRTLAARIEDDAARLNRWWTDDAIEELGGLTPAQLLAAGQRRPLEAFLRDIIAGQRG